MSSPRQPRQTRESPLPSRTRQDSSAAMGDSDSSTPGEDAPVPGEGDDDTGNAEPGAPGGGGGGDLPMSMMASVILTNLPKDASEALTRVDEIDDFKVTVRFQPIGSAPMLKRKEFKISASLKFSAVLNFLRKKIGVKDGDGLFLYVNSVFAPGLDEGVGNLFRVLSKT